MAGGIAHDFNNLLLAIMGNADLLDQELAEGFEGRPLLEEIRKAAGRAADSCNQLLAYAGKGQLNLQTVDLPGLAREMVQMLRVAISRKITLRLNLRDDLPHIQADAIQVQQVIMNLVVNASESIGPDRKGVISLTTDKLRCPAQRFHQCFLDDDLVPGDYVFLEVADTGAGMDFDTMQRIFDPFFSTKLHGRGLGLASVLGIAKAHQGAVCVKSDLDSGSVFRMCFPVDPLGIVGEQGRKRRSSILQGQGMVLVVDDEEYLRVLCTRMLKRLGYEVIQAADGPQALEIFRERGPEIDCVMLDLIMPIMDGSEVLDKLLDHDPQARVVMTSGYHQREISRRFHGRGIAGFLQKPYILADLADVLSEALSSERPDIS